MEYLEGIDLQTLVDQYGPQPPGRVIHLLRQMCGSLYEAHSKGLVHRDVKPANLMLTRRGGEADVVKVLDFGLVKAREDAARRRRRRPARWPARRSTCRPRRSRCPSSVDGCSDIYAVGAVGYFLLTGEPVFEASIVMELCNKHVNETPVPPSHAAGQAGAGGAGERDPGVPGKVAGQAAADGARSGPADRPLPCGGGVDDRRSRSLVEPPRPRPSRAGGNAGAPTLSKDLEATIALITIAKSMTIRANPVSH